MNHGHNQIRGIRPEKFLELPDAVGYLDSKTYALAGFGELVFQLGAVGHKDHLPV